MKLTKENTQFLAKDWNPVGWNDFVQDATDGFFSKGDTALTIATTAVWRAIFGKVAWWWVNYKNPAFGCMRKVPWTKSGERIVRADPATAACQGVDEGGALPDAQVPTFLQHATQFKQVVTRYQVTRKMKRAIQLGDDSVAEEDLRNWAIKHNALEINKMILEDAETTAGAASAHWAGKSGFEALDRIISADGEEDDLGGTHDNYYDPWTKYESTAGGTVWDRDSVTTYDAVVYHADGTVASGNPDFTADATLGLEAIDTLIDATQEAGADPRFQVFITGYDTARAWAHLIAPKQRFDNYERMSVSVNGVQSVEGRKAGFRVGIYDDIPIIRDHNCPADTKSKIYLVDSRSLYFKVATPTFLMTPAEAESYVGLDKLTQDHWLLTEGELWCTDPTVQGKLVAIK